MLARYVSFSLSLALSISRFKPFIKDKCFLPLQSCGVDYEVKAYIAKEADDPDEKISKKYVLVECHKFHTTVQYMPFAVARNQIIVYSDGFLPLPLSCQGHLPSDHPEDPVCPRNNTCWTPG